MATEERPAFDENGDPILYITDDDQTEMWLAIDKAARSTPAEFRSYIERKFAGDREALLRVNACFMRYASRMSVDLDRSITEGPRWTDEERRTLAERPRVGPVPDEKYVGFIDHLLSLGRDTMAELTATRMKPLALNPHDPRFFHPDGTHKQTFLHWVDVIDAFLSSS